MRFFRRRRPETVVSVSKCIGNFNPAVPGYYENVETAFFEARRKVPVSVRVKADRPVDVSVMDPAGEPADFVEQVTEYAYDLRPPADGPMAVIVAVYAGDRANIELTVDA
ncbi:MAG: hypothetical protein GX224_03780 [Thermoplasmatales archaeon]|nr:hypothetical protein [Thermoplasmatales archaeon]